MKPVGCRLAHLSSGGPRPLQLCSWSRTRLWRLPSTTNWATTAAQSWESSPRAGICCHLRDCGGHHRTAGRPGRSDASRRGLDEPVSGRRPGVCRKAGEAPMGRSGRAARANGMPHRLREAPAVPRWDREDSRSCGVVTGVANHVASFSCAGEPGWGLRGAAGGSFDDRERGGSPVGLRTTPKWCHCVWSSALHTLVGGPARCGRPDDRKLRETLRRTRPRV